MKDFTRNFLQERLNYEVKYLGEIRAQITHLNDRLDELFKKESKSNEIIKALEEDLNK